MATRFRLPASRRGSDVLLRALLVIGSLAFCVVLLEGFLRVTDYVPADVNLYRPNPAGGGSFRLKPHLNIMTRLGATPVAIHTNSHGMRWRETPQHADHALRRVAFVGDSFTFGLWADSVEHSLAGVAESVLRPSGFEVLNFGVPGYGLLDIELQIRQEVLTFNPRDIVLTTYNGNDLLDTYLGLDRYRVSGNGTLQLDDRILSQKIPARFLDQTWSLQEAARRRFRLYSLVSHARKQLSMRRGDRGDARIPTTDTYTSNVFWSRTRYPEFAEQARTAFSSALDRIKALCDEHDIRLPQQRLEDFARAASVPYLDLLPPLATEAREHGKNLHVQSDGHFNTLGHQVSGQLIADFFLRAPVQ